ncbi:hypothetical protein [Streptomyces sp. NBC_01171]|uniref:hypothetical protein n=1 Tax=Streptomyces sp. NBC_01171 TaxID=2903757 RepID=UPI0038658E15|nr:tubulin-like doman-containing protein [Streptomyces sp. NBC_01171]
MEIARLVLDYLKALVWPVVFLIVAFRFKPEIARLIRRIRTLSAPGVDAEFSDEVAEISAETEAAVRQAQRDTQGVAEEPGEASTEGGRQTGTRTENQQAHQIEHEAAEVVEAEAQRYEALRIQAVEERELAYEDERRRLFERSNEGASLSEMHWSTPELMAALSPSAGMLAAWQPIEQLLYDLAPGGAASQLRPIGRVIDSLPGVPHDVKHSLHDLRRLRNDAAHERRGETVSRSAALNYVRSCRTMLSWLEEYRRRRESGA